MDRKEATEEFRGSRSKHHLQIRFDAGPSVDVCEQNDLEEYCHEGRCASDEVGQEREPIPASVGGQKRVDRSETQSESDQCVSVVLLAIQGRRDEFANGRESNCKEESVDCNRG